MTPVQDPDREERLNHMVLAYEKDLLRLCAVYLRDIDLAQDAVQETFLKAHRRMNRFEGRASEKTWLMRIAINTWNVICQGRIYPIQKFLSHNTHNSIKIAKETVMCCLFCGIGYGQSFHHGFVLIQWLSLFRIGINEKSPRFGLY